SADTTIRNTTRWGKTKQDYLLTAFSGEPDTSSANPADWTLARNLPTFKNQTNEIITNQTNLTTSFETGSVKHDLSAGFEITREEQKSYGTSRDVTDWPDANLYNPQMNVTGPSWERNGADSSGSTDTIALYAFDTLKLNERWQVNAGARLDHYKTKYNALAV